MVMKDITYNSLTLKTVWSLNLYGKGKNYMQFPKVQQQEVENGKERKEEENREENREDRTKNGRGERRNNLVNNSVKITFITPEMLSGKFPTPR